MLTTEQNHPKRLDLSELDRYLFSFDFCIEPLYNFNAVIHHRRPPEQIRLSQFQRCQRNCGHGQTLRNTRPGAFPKSKEVCQHSIVWILPSIGVECGCILKHSLILVQLKSRNPNACSGWKEILFECPAPGGNLPRQASGICESESQALTNDTAEIGTGRRVFAIGYVLTNFFLQPCVPDRWSLLATFRVNLRFLKPNRGCM